MLKYKIKNKKAQIGETMTWVFATLIIIAILIISIYLASLLANTKKTFTLGSDDRRVDIVMEKSLFAYFPADAVQKRTIYENLKTMTFHTNIDNKLNEMRGILR